MRYHTVIIGCGISGMSAAIYLKRANIDVCLFEENAPGGQLLRTSTVENYPGVRTADGATLALELYQQISELEIPVYFEKIENVTQEEGFIVKTKQQEIICDNLILATGRNPKKLGLSKEEKLTGKGISYCATCDGALYKGKDVAVVGAGNSAFEEALYLSNLCSKVTLIARREEYRAENSLVDKVRNQKNVEILNHSIISELVGESKIEKIKVKNTKEETEKQIEVAGVFVYIGQLPTTTLAKDLNIKLEDDYICTNEKMETNIEGVYACGDCRKKDLYQLVTASYDGIIAANQIIKKKNENLC